MTLERLERSSRTPGRARRYNRFAYIFVYHPLKMDYYGKSLCYQLYNASRRFSGSHMAAIRLYSSDGIVLAPQIRSYRPCPKVQALPTWIIEPSRSNGRKGVSGPRYTASPRKPPSFTCVC